MFDKNRLLLIALATIISIGVTSALHYIGIEAKIVCSVAGPNLATSPAEEAIGPKLFLKTERK